MLMGGAARAADPAGIESPSDWSGAFIGAFAAYSWSDLDYHEQDWAGFERSPCMQGFSGGPLLGYSCRVSNIVAGLEADMGFGNLRDGPSDGPITMNNYSAFKIQRYGHVRARLGFVTGSTLIYFAGGVSLADLIVLDRDTDPDRALLWGGDKGTHVGWTAGAGIERPVTEKLRARFEYLHDDYGCNTYLIDGIDPYRAHVDLSADTLRAGLSYHF